MAAICLNPLHQVKYIVHCLILTDTRRFPPLSPQVDSGEFIHCREMVDEYLHSLEFSLPANAVYIFDSAQIQEEQQHRAWSPSWRMPQRKPGLGSDEPGDSDEYYDGLRRLYDEDMTSETEASEGGGLFDSKQKNASPCPPLHPPLN